MSMKTLCLVLPYRILIKACNLQKVVEERTNSQIRDTVFAGEDKWRGVALEEK